MTDPRIARAEQIAKALTGYRTEDVGRGCWVYDAKVWAKGSKVRVYLDKRYVDREGNIEARVFGGGNIDLIPGGIVYAIKDDANAIRRAVEAI
ncbi:hypothetical protein [Zavarzinia aquatilis]|nr:hypothetical protein [Zavarzinia aquatilis]